MDRAEYLLLLAGCVVLTLPLEFRGRARIWRRPVPLARALLLPYLCFNAVGELAVNRKVWWYSRGSTLGLPLPRHYPVEQALYFLVVPVCALLVFEVLRTRSGGSALVVREVRAFGWANRHRDLVRIAVLFAALAGFAVVALRHVVPGAHRVVHLGARAYAVLVWDADWNVQDFTVLAVVLVVAVLLVELWNGGRLFRLRAYWLALAAGFVLVLLVDGWLTKLSSPIVVYAADEFTGWRPLWDIPFEGWLLAWSLLTMTMGAWDREVGRPEVSGPDPSRSGRAPREQRSPVPADRH